MSRSGRLGGIRSSRALEHPPHGLHMLPTANRCYAKIGFKPACRSWHYPRARVAGQQREICHGSVL